MERDQVMKRISVVASHISDKKESIESRIKQFNYGIIAKMDRAVAKVLKFEKLEGIPDSPQESGLARIEIFQNPLGVPIFAHQYDSEGNLIGRALFLTEFDFYEACPGITFRGVSDYSTDDENFISSVRGKI